MMEVARRGWWLLSGSGVLMMVTAASVNPHAGYNTQDINFGRFFKAATQTSKRLLKEVFLLMISRYQVRAVDKWPTTVAEFCADILSWSKSKYRNGFNEEERSVLEQPLASADYDVSLLTKMIHKLLPEMNLPESFLRALRELKNVRNRVCHQHQLLDDANLRGNFDDLKVIFDNVLRETGEFFTADVADLKNMIQHETDEILSSPLPADASKYFDFVEKFRVDLVGKFITYARPELMNEYCKLKTLNPFTWLSNDQFPEMVVGKIFTPLDIEDDERTVDIESLLSTESLCPETQEASGILPSALLLSGIAGCGKTSLCRYLLHDWRARPGKIAALRSVDVILHIEVRNITSSSLLPHLQNTLLRETCKLFEENDVIKILQQMNVLYIIDGMDEATADGKKLVNEVLSVVGNARVIITTRPEFTCYITQALHRYRLTFIKLRIQGFSDQGITEFTSNVFAALVSDEEKRRQQECEFLRLLKTTGRGLGDHLKLPLTLAMVICLSRDDQSRLSHVTSATSLYSEIFRMCTMKMISRLDTTTGLHPLQMETFTEEWLLALGKEALEMLDDNEFVISDDRRNVLMSLCAAKHIDSIQVLSAFLMCEVNESIKGTQYEFRFIHKSQMEYLAAIYLVYTLNLAANTNGQKIADILQKLGATKVSVKVNKLLVGVPESRVLSSMKACRWSNTLSFIVGLLCKNKASDFLIHDVVKNMLEMHLDSFNAPALWQMVQESGCHPLVCKMVSGASYKNFVWRPKQKDLCNPTDPIFQLFIHTRLKLKAAVIRVVGSDQEVNILAENGRVENKRYENLSLLMSLLAQRPSMGVVVRADQHFYCWGSPHTTDHLITTLLPKGNLTAVMCHLGERGAAALAAVKKIGEVCIRISDVSALRALRDSLSAITGKLEALTLRLDIPWTVSPSTLPTFKKPLDLTIVLKDVDDDHGVWAAEVIARLSSLYTEVDLVASSLTPSGGETFLKTLRERQVMISDKLTIRSFHKLEEGQYQKMAQMVQCSLCWWY
ncbi:uncharacterized protein LOC121860716 [Homarus americanus]|uniref:uncharacterized protein LOC121860716 n=1 Tax=Homarus americanus TaxID=6706 RepID=UPI001C45D55F|nr:uncharacterized protein LOC121860716 [Homarus americanus]